MLLASLLEDAADKWPDRPALWQPGGGPQGQWFTYQALENEANRIARRLLAHGLKPGARVGLMMDNSFAWVTAHFGILKAGGVSVALSTDVHAELLGYLLHDSEAFALILGKKYAHVFTAMPKTGLLPSLVLWDGGVPDIEPGGMTHQGLQDGFDETLRYERPHPTRIDIDLAALVYTSGSTGRPKGVMLSHLNLLTNMRSIAAYLELGPSDRVLAVLPFYYIYGLSLLYTHFLVGGSVLVDNRFAFPNVVLDTLEKQGATGFAGVPSTFMILLQKSNLLKRTFAGLRYVTQAGGALPAALQGQVQEAFKPAGLYIMYGATEAAPRLTYLHPERLADKRGSIGRAIPNVEVYVVDENGRRLGPGEVGEIAARGANIMMGYWKDPEATAEVLKHGLYLTGDLGHADADGYLFISGRKREFIKVGGNRVSSKEVEEALLGLPEVSEAAVIGIDDALLGEAILAFVVRRADGVNEDDIRNALKEHLPSFKVPKVVRFLEGLPKNSAGKVLKPRLRDLLAEN